MTHPRLLSGVLLVSCCIDLFQRLQWLLAIWACTYAHILNIEFEPESRFTINPRTQHKTARVCTVLCNMGSKI
jgi:hypothetical protein